MSSDRDLRNSIEFLPGRLYYIPLSSNPPANSVAVPQKHFFSIDNELVYWNFFLDFGPLNLGQTFRFCQLLNSKLSDTRLKDKIIYFYSGTHPHRRANAAFLICAWTMLCLDKSPEEAFRPFRSIASSFPTWHDATPTACPFNLTIMDTLKGLHKARECNFFDFKNFNVEEYEHFEKVENGDLNWYVEGKFIAFAGPHATRETSPGGYHTLCPENYIPYFKRKNVTLVVRLNKKYYDARKFISQGIDHADMYFLDGSNPPQHILRQFIQRCEETSGAVAVHCKAGLGRTGSCIGCYIMKHHKFTAEEIIGWMRIVRPGSIIGPQQDFMREVEQQMWRDGDMQRTRLTQQLTFQGQGSGCKEELEDDKNVVVGLVNRIGSLSVKSGSSKELMAAALREEEGNSQGDHLRARRNQMKDEAANTGSNSNGASATPTRSGRSAAASSTSASISSVGKSVSYRGESNRDVSLAASLTSSPSSSSLTGAQVSTPPFSSSSSYSTMSSPSPSNGNASPKRKSALGTFLGF